jgi:DNA-binding transcriptional LysR family regulator
MKFDNLDLNKVATFLAIAESGSVTRAGERLALTRSAVSHSLGALESALELSLFHRVGKRLVLTSEGRVLRQAARAMRDRLEGALDELSGLGTNVGGTVRLGVFVGFSRFQLSDRIDRFVTAHPAASVRIAYGPQNWLLDELLGGRLDLTLSFRPTDDRSRRITSEKLSPRPLVLAIRAGRDGPPSAFDDVARLRIVDYYASDPVIDRWTRHHFAGRTVPRARIAAFAGSTDLVLQLVLRGTGAAVLPRDMVRPFQGDELVIVTGKRRPLMDSLWLNAIRGARPTRAVAAFRQVLVETGDAPKR